MDERIYQIALSQLSGIGPVLSRKLLTYCGSASAVFSEKPDLLRKISGFGAAKISMLRDKSVFKRAEAELRFIEQHKLQMVFIDDADFPSRLQHCYDSPIVLYHCGNTDLNASRIVSIVGTREPSGYGRDLCEQLVADLAAYNVLVVSGLAYGVDAIAHRAAIENNVKTLGVLAHGLDQIYPFAHRALARKMVESGGLLTDFPSNTKPDRENFPMRNRIVAGLSDAVVVVESGVSGGSLITAEYANNYNRDVFAFPGRVGDERSAGCLKLIRNHKAALITSAADLALSMNWETGTQTVLKADIQPAIHQLETAEASIVELLNGQGEVHISALTSKVNMCHIRLLDVMTSLEMNGWVKSIPGNYYRLLNPRLSH
ncbi:MAG: DNA-processing protein DprA [Bacteroidia bacterium]